MALVSLILTPIVLFYGMKEIAREVRLLGYRDIEDDPDDPDPLEDDSLEDEPEPEDPIETDPMKVH